uniref:Tetraspanin n=1 Tax=Strigamia maritima TaxID=126957 RepID=T1IXU1_STRMM
MSELKGGAYCIKYLLFVFNFVFWLLGCTVMALGIWVRADYVSKQVIEQTGFEYYFAACYMVITTGAIIMIIGFTGCMGALMENRLLLTLNIIFLAAIFILELAAGAYVFSVGVEGTSLDEFLVHTLSKAIHESGYDPKARKMMDVVQSYLYCCGVNNWKDYQDWGKAVPNSCRNEITGRQFDMGCKERFTLFIEEKTGLIGGISLSICLIQIVGITFSVCLCQAVK